MKAEQNRERILDSALRLIAEQGYAETSLGDVATHAGLLKGNLCYYFKTKATLLEAVCERLEAHYWQRIQGDKAEVLDPIAAIEGFLRMVEESAPALARLGCPIGSLASELGKDEPALQPFASRILQRVQDWLAAQFALLKPAEEAAAQAESLLAHLQGASVLAHAFRDESVIHRQVAAARAALKAL